MSLFDENTEKLIRHADIAEYAATTEGKSACSLTCSLPLHNTNGQCCGVANSGRNAVAKFHRDFLWRSANRGALPL